MSNTPIPPASSTPPTRPQRPWTILGRLSKAVREQNWFAVVLEVAIVIVGVVIGFQVTAWGQARSDVAKEQTYLRQLQADLDVTLRDVAHEDSLRDALATPALLALLGSWGSGPPLPADSIVTLTRRMLTVRTVQPTRGTAEALVTTGDLTLLRSDSLRAAITAYLGATQVLVAFQLRTVNMENDAFGRLIPEVGSNRVAAVDLDMDLFQPSISLSTALTDSGWVPPFPLEAEGFYGSREAYDALSAIAVMRQGRESILEAMSRQAQDLRQLVKAELNR